MAAPGQTLDFILTFGGALGLPLGVLWAFLDALGVLLAFKRALGFLLSALWLPWGIWSPFEIHKNYFLL